MPKRAKFHRERCLVSPRTTPGITANTVRLSLESMDLDTEQLSRFLIHNNLRTVTIGDLDSDRTVVFRETVCYNICIQNSFL